MVFGAGAAVVGAAPDAALFGAAPGAAPFGAPLAMLLAEDAPTISLAIYALAPILYFLGMLLARRAPDLEAAG